jgi:hypothetical protein
VKQVSAFATADGKLFESAEQAHRHEFMLAREDTVNEFITSQSNNYKSIAQRAIVKNTILNWELWKIRNDIE